MAIVDAKAAELAADLANRFGDDAPAKALEMAIDAAANGDGALVTMLIEIAMALTEPPTPSPHLPR